MQNTYTIRLIEEGDADAALAIYRPYVLESAITFEYEVPSADEYLQRIRTNAADYPWLLCLNGERIVGFAYGSRHRYRTAYQWSAESTIYLAPGAYGKGIAKLLYETLFSMLRIQGYFNVYAGVALPNERSEGLHRAMGFEAIGDFKKIGYKLGKWHDVRWFQLHLAQHTGNPPAPKSMQEITGGEAFKEILSVAAERLLSIRK